MLPAERLRDKLIVMNGKGVQVYRDLAGAYRFERFELHLDAVHPDPAAPWVAARIRVDQAEAQVPAELFGHPAGRVAVQDFLARGVRDAIHHRVRTRWPGRMAQLAIETGRQEILPRTCCIVEEDFVEIRLTIGLPADGRKVVSKPAQTLLFDELPAVVDAGVVWASLDGEAGWRHCQCYEDYLTLQALLPELGLVSFVADGSILGRDAGMDDRPLRGARAISMHAPEELAVTVTLPHRGVVRGLGIRRGVTVLTGTFYSGKSTLLAAIGSGVYAHVPGDGRELVATVPDAVMIGADPGRRIERVDVSMFVHTLPHSHDVTALSTEHATGALSMAASTVEALEMGASVLLFDEDDSAIAFVARDAVMRLLVPGLKDAFTPLVERVRGLWEQHGISTVIATGGLGEYLDVADTVLVVEGFQPTAATARARELVAHSPRRDLAATAPPRLPAPRCPLPRGVGGMKGRGLRAELRGRASLSVGRDTVDLAALPLLVDPAQARAAGDALLYAVEKEFIDGNASIRDVVDRVFADIAASGLSVLAVPQGSPAHYAMPRPVDVSALLNRLRSLQVRTRRPVDQAVPVQEPDRPAPEPSERQGVADITASVDEGLVASDAAREPAEGSEREGPQLTPAEGREVGAG